jgi:hypothetical protein
LREALICRSVQRLYNPHDQRLKSGDCPRRGDHRALLQVGTSDIVANRKVREESSVLFRDTRRPSRRIDASIE